MLHDKDKYSNKPKGVKPKNRVYCPDCNRQKMKFDSEKEALNFIKWNRANFDDKIPSRIYWCKACCGFHITARPMGNVGVTINMDLPYLTEALEKDKHRVMHAVKMIHKTLYILKQPPGYYGKSGLGRCKSILDSLDYAKNPYYIEQRKEIYGIVEQLRAQYSSVWLKRKYCRLIKTKLYRTLCDVEHGKDVLVKKYLYDLTYILGLAKDDKYNLEDLPELFLDEWETLFKASPVSECLTDKMKTDGTDKDNSDEETLLQGEEYRPGIQVSNQSEGL